MKSVLLVALGLSAGLLAGWGIWGHHSSSANSVSLQPIPLRPVQPALVSPQPFSPIAPSSRPGVVDWQAFQNAREKALQDNPDLAAEYKELVQEASDQEQEVKAAMIKADPKVAAILAKLEAQRQPSGVQRQ